MVEKNSNLLLSAAAKPDDGIQYGSTLPWYGGRLQVSASGEFDGATVDLLFCTNLPKREEGETLEDVLVESDWITLTTLTEGGVYSEDLNPCVLATRVNTSGDDTRVKVIVS